MLASYLANSNGISFLMPSSVIESMQYDPVSTTLRVVFVSGIVYDYKKVPLEVYQAMKNAVSKGSYLNKYIKGNYDYKKLKSK